MALQHDHSGQTAHQIEIQKAICRLHFNTLQQQTGQKPDVRNENQWLLNFYVPASLSFRLASERSAGFIFKLLKTKS